MPAVVGKIEQLGSEKDARTMKSILNLANRFTRKKAVQEVERRKPSKFDNRLVRIRDLATSSRVIKEDVIPILVEWLDQAEDVADRNVKDHMVLVTQQGVKNALRRVKALLVGQGQPEEAP